MDKIERFIYERSVDVQELSDREQIQKHLSQPSSRTADSTARLVKQLNNYRVLGGAWESLSLVDTKGTTVLSTSKAESFKALQNQPQFKEAYQKALTGEASYTDLFAKNTEGAPIMLLMAPVRDAATQEQSFTGVIVGELAWQSALEILRSIQQSQAVLLNQQGFIIGQNTNEHNDEILKVSHTQTPAFQKAQTNAQGAQVLPGVHEEDNNNQSFVTSYVKANGYLDYRGNGWILILQTPTSQAFSPVAQLTKSLLLTFLAILLFSIIAFLLILNRQIKRPISQLLEAVTRLAKGDFSSRLQLKSKDELGELAHAFNDMADKLQLAYDKLKAATATAEEERNILHTILDNLPVGVFVAKTPDGKPVLINKVGLQLLGEGLKPDQSSQDQAEIYEITQPNGDPYPNNELPLTISLKTGRPAAKDDLVARGEEGTARELRAISAPIKDGEGRIESAVVVLEDITEERVLARSRDEFFSIASHELRTPLTAIRGNASMLLTIFGDEIKNADTQDMIEDIHQSSMRLIEIVNDFLDLSRIEQGKVTFQYESVELDKVIESVVYEMQAVLQEKHLSLDFNHKTLGELPQVWADKNRLKQILYNLVGNAAKFTDQGGITIQADVEGDKLKVQVIDTGRGISEKNQKLLFHKFQQAGESLLTRDTTRGTGLGLYISKMLTASMGGELGLEYSHEGQGSCFGFTIPLASAPHVANDTIANIDTHTGLAAAPTLDAVAAMVVTPQAQSAMHKLLVVEDDPYVLRLYQRLFNTTDITLKTAINGKLGYELAQEFRPNLILLDMMMPVMNGLETLKALQKNTKTRHIPVIMLSNFGEEPIIKQALECGATAYLIKSDFTPEQLLAAITEKIATPKASDTK
jgi:two-component system, sensor histidine kinase and response regulator